MENNGKLTFKQYLIIAVVSVTLFVTLWNYKEVLAVISSLFSYILPLFIGACIAFALNVPMKLFERLLAYIQRKCKLKVRHTLNTYISLVITVVALIAVVSVFVNYMAPRLAESGADIVDRFKEWYPTAIDFLREHDIQPDILDDLDINKVINYFKGYFSLDNTIGIVNTVISAASSTVSVVISALSCLVFSIYMLVGKKRLNHQARKVLYAYTPRRFADKTCHIGSLFYKTFYNYVYSQCIDALILALLLYVTLRIFHIPYAGIICIITGVLALIPYVGALISCVVGALLLLLVSPFKALIFVAIFLIVQQIEGQLIYPHLVGTSIGLPAIWTLFAAIVGGEMMGLFGIVFFIPLAAVIYTLIKEGTAKRLSAKGIKVEAPADTEEREKMQKMNEKSEKRRAKKEEKKEQKTKNNR